MRKRAATSVKTNGETKSQWRARYLIIPVILAIIAVIPALLGMFKSNGGHNITAGNISGNVAIGEHATVQTLAAPPVRKRITNFPQIRIETLTGLPMGRTNDSALRVHHLLIRNLSNLEIHDFCGRLQIAEPIVETTETNSSVGVYIGWKPRKVKMFVQGTGGRTEGGTWLGPHSTNRLEHPVDCFLPPAGRGQKASYFGGAGELTGVWELTINKLPQGGFLSIFFITSNAKSASNYIEFASTPLWQSPPNPSSQPDIDELRFLFEGEFYYEDGTETQKQYYFVPIKYEADQRTITSMPVQTDVGHWHPVVLDYY